MLTSLLPMAVIYAYWGAPESSLKQEDWICDNQIPLRNRPSKAACRRVYVREAVVVPPNSEMNVPIMMVRSSFRTPTASWVVGPTILADKVFAARVLLPDEDKHAAVRIINLSNEDYSLEGGRHMGQAEVGQVNCVQRAKSHAPSERGGHACQAVAGEPDDAHLQPVIDALPDSLER